MEFKFNSDDLRSPLSIAESLTEERSPIPALSNILLDLTDSTLTLTSTDFRSTFRRSILVDAVSGGSCLVPGKTFSKWISRISGVVSAKLTDSTLRLKTPQSQLTLKTMPVLEFPVLDFSASTPLFSISAAALSTALKQAAVSADPADAIPMRHSIALDLSEPDALSLVATDGTRMSRVSLSATFTPQPKPLLLARGALPDLWRSLAGLETVTLKFDARRLIFEAPDFLFALQLTDVEYLLWRSFFNDSPIALVSVPTADLKSAILRISETTTEVNWVHLSITPDALILDNAIQGNDAINHGVESIPLETHPANWEMHVNIAYIKDALTVSTSPTLQLGMLRVGSTEMLVLLDGDTTAHIIAPMAIDESKNATV